MEIIRTLSTQLKPQECKSLPTCWLELVCSCCSVPQPMTMTGVLSCKLVLVKLRLPDNMVAVLVMLPPELITIMLFTVVLLLLLLVFMPVVLVMVLL